MYVDSLRRPPVSGTPRHTCASTLILAACAAALLCAAMPAPAAAMSPPASAFVEVTLPATTLHDALLRVGQASGITLISDPGLTADRRVPASHLRGDIVTVLQALLQGTGLRAVPNANGEGYRIVSAPAARQADDTVAALAPVTVIGDRLADVGVLPVQASAATKTDTPLLETAQSISVVNREYMEMIGAESVQEALRYSAGVTVGGYGVDSRVDEISVRGFRTGSFANNLYLDGLRAPGSSSGASASAAQFDGFGIERVEVLRGPSSVLYGQIAPGGLINATSKRPTAHARGELGASTDNEGLARVNADMSGPLDAQGEWLYRVVGTAYRTDTQVDHVELKRVMLAPSLTWRPSARTSVTLLANYQRDSGGNTYQFLPSHGTYVETPSGRFDTHRYLGEPGFSAYARTQRSIGYEASHALTDGLRIEQRVRYMQVDTDNHSVARQGDLQADGRTLLRSASINEVRSEGLSIDNNLKSDFRLGESVHTMLAGLDYRTQTIRVRQASGRVGPLDVFAPVYGGPVIIGSPVPSRRTDSEQTGMYVQDQARWRQWTATFGLRHDWSRDNALVRATNAATHDTAEATTWRAGLVYLFDNGLAPYASYATSFEPVSGTNFEGEPFKPTKGRQAEVGVKFQPVGSRSLLTASIYEIRQQNILTPDPDPTRLCEGRLCQVQTGEGRVRGLELEGNLALSEQLTLIASATWMGSKVTRSNDDNLGNALARVPRRSFNLWLDYRFDPSVLPGLSVGLGLRHTGASYGDAANHYRSPTVNLIDAALRYDMARLGPAFKGMKFSLNATNLADKAYLASCSGSSSCYYGARRSITANLNYAW